MARSSPKAGPPSKQLQSRVSFSALLGPNSGFADKLVTGQLGIAEDLRHEATVNGLTGMDGDHGRAAIRVA